MNQDISGADQNDFTVSDASRRRLITGAAAFAAAFGLPKAASAEPIHDAVSPSNLDQHYFPGFRRQSIQTSGALINVLVGGSGSPLLLVHGLPENHLTWRYVAPKLAEHYTVVVPDLRGYGDSEKPDGGTENVNYSQRAMALDQIEVMKALGFDRFAIVGHDRGGRVTHRLLLDHPEQVTKAVIVDVVPTDYIYKTLNRQVATGYWHWVMLIQPAPLPEALIENSTDKFLTALMFGLVPKTIKDDIYQDYLRCLKLPGMAHAICEDYRAGAGIDLVHATADQGRKIEMPLHLLWGAKGLTGIAYQPLTVWQDYATRISGRGLACGHFVPEEAPDDVVNEVHTFLQAS